MKTKRSTNNFIFWFAIEINCKEINQTVSIMSKKIIYLSIILFPILFSSCLFGPTMKGNGHVVDEVRKVKDFDGIKASRGINVYITQGNEKKVLVRADENLLDAIETKVHDNILIVRSTAMIRKAESFKVFVTVPELELIEASSGSNVFSETDIKSNDLELSSSSGANMTLDIDAGEVSASASSGANIRLDGLAEDVDAKVSSGANIKAEDLKTKSAELKASSGGNIWISVHKQLSANASSGGNIHYYGEPSELNINTSSGGNVVKR